VDRHVLRRIDDGKTVDGRIETMASARLALREEDPLPDQALDGLDRSGLAQTSAVVEGATVASADAGHDLAEGYRVGGLMEAEGAADDVHHDLELSGRETSH
jgi:hypothetical protein